MLLPSLTAKVNDYCKGWKDKGTFRKKCNLMENVSVTVPGNNTINRESISPDAIKYIETSPWKSTYIAL